jgi:hypothetical protein
MQSKRAKPFRLSYLRGKELSVGFGVSAKIVCVFRGAADEGCEHLAGPDALKDDALYVVRAVDPETRRVHLVGVASPWRSDGTEVGWNPTAFISLPLLKQWHEYRRLLKEKRAARRKPREDTGDWERDPEWWNP